uniref:Selenocysteine insertion sequence-binding protein 2 n=2 Tax=Lygus hesperus TaxID=30085 RepID=A0A146KQ37_LYGHE
MRCYVEYLPEMYNFRNVVLGSSGIGNDLEEWPELGNEKPKARSESNKIPAQVAIRPNSGDSPAKKEEIPRHLDAQEFPALGRRVFQKPKKRDSQLKGIDISSIAVQKPKKKKIKKSTPLQVDICEIIQASALKKKQTSEIAPLKKTSKIKRKVISGNHLDADQPKRHKGKVRPWKPRDLSSTKKLICASRKIRLTRLNFTKDIIRFKESFGNALKVGKVDVDELVKDLSQIEVNDTRPEASKIAKDIIHTKKFRSYCNNLVTPELKQHAGELVTTLRKFQDRMHAKDEIKAHAKRRYVCGFNESRKFLLADRVKLLLVATNLEMEEGLPSMDVLKRLVDAAEERNIPVVYAGLGHNIGYWTLKKAKISVLAVMNYEGANEAYSKLLKSWTDGRAEYDKLTSSIVDLCLSKSPKLISAEEVKKEVEDEIKETILRKLKEITSSK